MKSGLKIGLFGGIPLFAIVLFAGWMYIGNLVKLIQCDWKSDGSWKGEVIHAVGVVVPPASFVTYWFDDK